MQRGRTFGGGLLAALATVTVVLIVSTFPVLGRGVDADGDRCARFAFQSEARARIVTGEGPEVAVLGDSYSVGLGLRKPADSWPARLPGRVRVQGFSGSGFAQGASSCSEVSYAERVRLLPESAATVVVEGGLNDVDRPDREVVDGVREVLAALEGRQVLVVGPVPAPARTARVARVDALLAQECDRAGVAYLSMLGSDLPYLADRLHLTAAGHRAFGDAVAHRLARLSADRG